MLLVVKLVLVMVRLFHGLCNRLPAEVLAFSVINGVQCCSKIALLA